LSKISILNSQKFLDFCKTLIETYILVLIKLQQLQNHKDSFLNSLNIFRVTSEERQNYVKLTNFSPLSAGFSHGGAIVDNSVYLWGRNDVNCAMNRSVLQSGENEILICDSLVEMMMKLYYKDAITML
jgi:hypothetical protein